MAKIKVELKERSYEIVVGTDILSNLGKIIKEAGWGSEIFIITDQLVNELFGDKLRQGLISFSCQTLEIPRGERQKNLKIAAKLYDELVDHAAHRDSLILALGGGVIGDLAGFVAATYMRGINYIQVPTTLLAQVDAAIGGKTGVNHPNGKNLIGAFYQPKLVYSDLQCLSSLPARELRTGLAEVVKYGIIEDADFFQFLETNAHHLNTKAFESPDTLRAALKVWQTIVAESAKIKATVVSHDEMETGRRMILNFGHTIGHALESLTHYKAYNHGEAVAIGMVATAKIAQEINLLAAPVVERIRSLLTRLELPVKLEGINIDKVISAMGIDKKVKGGKLRLALPEAIGNIRIVDDIPAKTISRVLQEMGCQ
ncbi:3-dehydroquinate synthase [Candidatus Saganbacteria bacterium]|nr:3-dehydroquinate synthase [Candidatus Saganbacteria bacterium]